MDSLIGTTLSHYRITEKIGAGGMGVVYRARDERLGRDVAVKVLPEDFLTPERRRRFETEARAAAALSHPNVLAVFDVSAQGENPFLVTELLDGQPLNDLLAAGPPPLRRALDLAVQTARGLAAAHDRGIIHRDVKPSNLFVQRDGTLKVLDFGLARIDRPPESLASARTLGGKPGDSPTTEGTVIGTVAYMAPEQVRGEAADARSDLFSFGCVLYELLSGRRAFDAPTAVESSYKILHAEPPPLPNSVPSAAARLCLRCLEKDPADRFQSARDLGYALELLDASESGTSRDPAASQGERTARAGRGKARLAVRAALLAALLAAAFVGGHQLPARAPASGDAVQYTQLTFRLGSIGNARFAPDGTSVIFSSSRNGRTEVFSAVPGNSEVRLLSSPETELLDVSAKGEMALLKREDSGRFVLARAPLAGGTPRPLLDDAISASWPAQGDEMLVVRIADNKIRIEYPLGHVLLERPPTGLRARVSPDGDRVALVVYQVPSYLTGCIEILDRDGNRSRLTQTYSSIGSLAWSPDGKEIWFTANKDRFGARTLMAVTLDGKERVVREFPAGITIHDCARDGRVLVSMETFHHRITGITRNHPRETDLSWFEESDQPSISGDGRWLLSTVVGEAAGDSSQVYLYDDVDGTAVHLGAGNALALSPDHEWALVGTGPLQSDLVLLPTGAGEPRRLSKGPIEAVTAAFWFPDGKRLLLDGHEPGRPPRVWLLDVSGEPPLPVSDEGTLTACPPSPDGKWIAAFTRGSPAFLIPVPNGPDRSLDKLPPRYLPIGWTEDGDGLFVRKLEDVSRLDGYVTTGVPTHIDRFDLATGTLTPWRELAPGEPAGRSHIDNVSIKADGRYYAYAYATFSSILFLVQGLR